MIIKYLRLAGEAKKIKGQRVKRTDRAAACAKDKMRERKERFKWGAVIQ